MTPLLRSRPRRPARQVARVHAGPFVGLRDSLDATISRDPQRARVIENLLPLELNKPSTLVGRPGFQVAGAQGGASGKRTGQDSDQFTKRDGTEITYRIIGGQGIQTFDWVTRAWTTVVSVANLTSASITLSETATVYSVVFADELVISDGVNTPFMWDGTSGSSGLTKLTAAPVFYGQPVVYYAKLFAIKATERNVIVWSEELDATIGYEDPAYADSWQLAQTDQEGFVALIATDEALYAMRERSITAVSGAVTSEFSSTGTREAVSPSVGTASPAGVCLAPNGRAYFIDADARIRVLVPGGGLKDLWLDIAETTKAIDQSLLSNAIAVYDPSTQLVLIGVTEVGQSIPSILIAINPVLDVPVAVWRGFTFQALGVVKDSTGRPTLMHLSDDGYAYDHGQLDGDLWTDELVAGDAAIRHTLETSHLAVDDRYEKRYNRADFLFRADGDASAVSVSHITPYGTSTPLDVSIAVRGTIWDQFNWDEANWSESATQGHVAVGLNGLGRWVRQRIQHEVAGERFGIEHVSVSFTPAGDSAVAA